MPTNDDVFLVGLTWESLGVLAFRREITLDLMGDFWRNNRHLVAQTACFRGGGPSLSETRDGLGLVPERMIEREKKSPPNAAHNAHRDWR